MVIQMGSNEGEAEEVWDRYEVAMWPQRQRLELRAHKLGINVDSHEALLKTTESEWADSSPGVGFWVSDSKL